MGKLRRSLSANDHYDLLVLGAGPAGLKAAYECARKGFRVGVVDPKESITGAPTGAHSKCLREAALGGASTWSEVETVLNRVRQSMEEMTATQIKTYHIELLKGSGRFFDHETLVFQPVQGETRHLYADSFVIATGSHATRQANIPFHLAGVFDSDTIGHISYLPKFMVVQGAGIIGIEYAIIFAILGSKVIIVQHSDRVAHTLDADLRQALIARLAEHNVEIRLRTPVKSVESANGCSAESPLLLVDTGNDVLECDCFLSVTGRSGTSHGIGLENLAHMGMKIGQNKMIEVDEFQHTGVAHIYAVGDVAGGSLATQGEMQAQKAIKKQFAHGRSTPYSTMNVGVAWTVPEVAWAGMTEQMAATKGIDFCIARVEYSNSVKGIISNKGGFLKLIVDRRNGEVLGVHMSGEHSCELIDFGTNLVKNGKTIFDIRHFIFPAVTYHQLYHMAADQGHIELRGVHSLSAFIVWREINVAIHKGGITKEEMKEAFSVFDNHNGQITVDSLHNVLDSIGVHIPKDDVKEMVSTVDEDGNGIIDFDEFKNALEVKFH